MQKLNIIYENQELLVVNKPPKLLTISDGKTTNTLYSMAKDYVKKQRKSNKIFIVHRLDKDTSGVVVFAKNEKLKKYLQANWLNITKRKYIAILEGKLPNKRGVIKEYLRENKFHQVYASSQGEYAETKYKVINYKFNNTLVNIEIITGKKNQIRVGFSNLGYPIVGDKKYGSATNPFHRLGLHAISLELNLNKQEYLFEAKLPKEFKPYIKEA